MRDRETERERKAEREREREREKENKRLIFSSLKGYRQERKKEGAFT